MYMYIIASVLEAVFFSYLFFYLFLVALTREWDNFLF